MKRKKEKVVVSISIDKKLCSYMDDLFSNKSKYIEWLIYEDLSKIKNLEKIII